MNPIVQGVLVVIFGLADSFAGRIADLTGGAGSGPPACGGARLAGEMAVLVACPLIVPGLSVGGWRGAIRLSAVPR